VPMRGSGIRLALRVKPWHPAFSGTCC
jgi:hypothetical protein